SAQSYPRRNRNVIIVAQFADGGAARRGEIHAGAAAAVDPAAAFAEGAAGSIDDRLDRRRTGRWPPFGPAPVPRAPSFGLHGGNGGGWPARAAGRGLACSSWRAFSRRIAGVHAAG